MPNNRDAELSRRAAGLCPHCGKAPEPGRKYCLAVLEYKRAHARNHPPRRCAVCRRALHDSASICPGCAAAAVAVRKPRGAHGMLQTTLPGRAETVARYALRAALGLPLFDES